jgi:hypothetical protein
MISKTTTFHVQLFPASRVLEAQQLERSYHRLRSTRKLEAPRLFLDLDSKGNIIPDTPTLLSPRTRATRRKGQVFDSPPDTSLTDSVESFCDLQPHPPSPSYIPSLAGTPVTNDNHGYPGSGIPEKNMTENKNKTIKTEGLQPLAQPFLLQLRSLPVPSTVIRARNPPVPHTAPLLSSNMYSTTTSTSSSEWIPPATSSHPHALTDEEPKSVGKRRVLTDDEKRRKLAKLARTLGENVPPELVFHSSSSPPLQRTTSMSVPRLRSRSHRASQSLLVSASPPSSSFAVAASPVPATTTPQSQPQQRTARPQSVALSTASPTTAPLIRGAFSDADHVPFEEISVALPEHSDQLEPPCEWGRREEEDWSGEWNVKDMRRVAKQLRGLKVR